MDTETLNWCQSLALLSSETDKFCHNDSPQDDQARMIVEGLKKRPEGKVFFNLTPDGAYCAFTGNGPKSEDNARFYFQARNIVLDLVDEVRKLREQLGMP